MLQRKGTVKVVVGPTRKAADTSELATAAWGDAFETAAHAVAAARHKTTDGYEFGDLRPMHDMSTLSTSGTAAYEEKCRSVWGGGGMWALVRGDRQCDRAGHAVQWLCVTLDVGWLESVVC